MNSIRMSLSRRKLIRIDDEKKDKNVIVDYSFKNNDDDNGTSIFYVPREQEICMVLNEYRWLLHPLKVMMFFDERKKEKT